MGCGAERTWKTRRRGVVDSCRRVRDGALGSRLGPKELPGIGAQRSSHALPRHSLYCASTANTSIHLPRAPAYLVLSPEVVPSLAASTASKAHHHPSYRLEDRQRQTATFLFTP